MTPHEARRDRAVPDPAERPSESTEGPGEASRGSGDTFVSGSTRLRVDDWVSAWWDEADRKGYPPS